MDQVLDVSCNLPQVGHLYIKIGDCRRGSSGDGGGDGVMVMMVVMADWME